MFNNNYNKNKQAVKNIEVASIILLSSLVFLLPLLYFGSLRDASSLPRYALYGFSSGIILSFILIKNFTEHTLPHFQQYLFLPVLLFLTWAWLSSSWSIDPKNSFLELIQLTGCIIIAFSISQLTRLKYLTIIITCSVLGASIASAIGIAQYFNFNPIGYHQFSIPASTFTNTNIATTYIDLITPLAFALIFVVKSKKYKYLTVVGSILCLSFLLLSHSRGSWLSLVFIMIGILFLLFKNTNFKQALYSQIASNKFYLIISIIIPFLLFFIPTNVSDQPVKNSQLAFDGSAKIRLDAYINSLAMVKDYPIMGSGYGGFKTSFRHYMFSVVPFTKVTEDNVFARLHNDLLQSFVELGLIGGLLFIYIYIILLQSCWRIIKKSTDPHLIFLVSGLLLAVIANGVHASVDFPFHKPSSTLQFWIWLGIISALSIKTIPVKIININKSTVILLIIFGLIFSLYNLNYYQAYINASKHRLIAENNINTGNCVPAQKSVDKMMDSFDTDFRHQSLYVAVYSQCDIDVKEKLFAMNRVLSYDETNTRAYITRGTIYLQQKSTQKAINDFLRVTQILPHRASGYIGLAYAALQNQNKSAAVKLLKYAKKVDPENELSSPLLNQINQDNF
ncbi:MAG: O-antigen ligase family protein [Gammaproteobacteria bacterium]|nr:O-antigen ligase family protein [Gammaproteobacteria bacterium]MCW8987204.1 O-antigen ligase family protein [Gammaproteobacteria bacterium]MCW9031318.1 O-antigen ligase family protein [Gammaproteobacteria bacterium]